MTRRLTLRKLHRAELALEEVLACEDFPADDQQEGGTNKRLVQQVIWNVLLPLEQRFDDADPR